MHDIFSLVLKCVLFVFVHNSQNPCCFSHVIYSSKVCLPSLSLLFFSFCHRVHISAHYSRPKQPPLTSPVGLPTPREWSQQQAASCHCAVWCGLGDHRFHNEVSTRMTDDVSPLILSLDSKVQETGLGTRGPEGNPRAEEMWEMWAA